MLGITCCALAGTIPAQAQNYADEIERLCTTERNRPSLGLLGQRIDALEQYHFTTPVARMDHDRVVSEIEGILAETSFAHVLECPAHVEALGYVFRVNTEKEGDWSVSSTDDSVTLNMSMRSSSISSLTTYLHEMVHVCQFARKPNTILRAQFVKPLRDLPEYVAALKSRNIQQQINVMSSWARYLAHQSAYLGMLGEMEAFLAMAEGYRELVRASPRICGDPASSLPWYKVWIENERQLVAGTFAQFRIPGYLSGPRYADNLDRIVDLAQPAVPYFHFVDGQMHELHPMQDDFRDAVIELGIPVNDRQRDIRQTQLAFEIQGLLQNAGCYEGALDNLWGPASLRALTDFSNQAGITFNTLAPTPETYLAVVDAAEADMGLCR